MYLFLIPRKFNFICLTENKCKIVSEIIKSHFIVHYYTIALQYTQTVTQVWHNKYLKTNVKINEILNICMTIES